MSLPRPCLDCPRLAPPGRSRCPLHERARDRDRQAHRRVAPGGAARRLRRRVNRAGVAVCDECGGTFPASAVEIDHPLPMIEGGRDVDANVRVLCRPCHRAKSADERRRRRRRR